MGLQEGRKGSVGPARLLAGGVSLLVLAVVIAALWIAGAPSAERSRRLDSQRLNDLQYISSSIDSWYARSAKLPASLDEMQGKGPTDSYALGNLTDPVTKVPYEYRTVDGSVYELCATFDLPSEDQDQTSPAYVKFPSVSTVWTHPAGVHCFRIDAEASRVACSLTNPCAAGQSCVTLPGKKGAACVPAGKECLAAGCSTENCAISESYPMQVSCKE